MHDPSKHFWEIRARMQCVCGGVCVFLFFFLSPFLYLFFSLFCFCFVSGCVSRARDFQVRSLWVFRFNPCGFFRFDPCGFFPGSIPVVPKSFFHLYFSLRLIIFREVAVLFCSGEVC